MGLRSDRTREYNPPYTTQYRGPHEGAPEGGGLMTETMRKGSGVSGALVDVRLSVLGYCEDSQWAALALEMDLRGYGETFEDALADLQDLIQMQISFALYKGHLEMIFKDAEPVYWQLLNTSR